MEKFLNPYDVLFEKLTNIEVVLLNRQQPMAAQTETYFKVDQAAEFLSTSPNALRVMVNKNQIPYIKKMGKLFFRQSDLVEWLESGSNISDDSYDPEAVLTATKKRS